MRRRLSFEFLAGGKYKLLVAFRYYSPRYKKWITVPEGFISDGASGPAEDIVSRAWWVHDKLCGEPYAFDDGTRCSNWKASWILHDILLAEKRWIRARTWFLATLVGVPLRDLMRRILAGIGISLMLIVGLLWAIAQNPG